MSASLTRVASFVLVFASMALLASCGGSTPGGGTTPEGIAPPPAEIAEPPALRDLVDLDAPLIVEVDVASIRESWLYPHIVELFDRALESELAANPQRREVVTALWDVVSRTSSAILVLQDEDHGVLVMRGRYTPEDVRRTLLLAPNVVEREGEGYVAFEERDGGVALLRDHTVVVASSANLSALLDRYTRRVRARPLDETIGATLAAIDSQTAALGGAVSLTPTVTQLLSEGPEPIALAASKLSTIGLRIDVAEGVAIRVIGRGADAETLRGLAQSLQTEVDRLRRHPVAILLGVRGILGAIRITSTESDLDISLSLSREQVESLARGLGAFVASEESP